MIQRIQSIFLLLAGGASLSLFGLPFATVGEAYETSAIFQDKAFNVMDHPGLMGLFGVAGLLAVVSIFLFKNRKLQMRLSIFAFIANLLAVIFGVIYFMQFGGTEVPSEKINDGIGMYMPIVALVMCLLAYRFINKDEKLVRSMDRLR